ncbi:MAG TPA: SpoIIE family protein phosphatase [Fimbriiglobus sp.]|jgi:serine phosphatase RsbU (regulator of sigma subunit)
MTAYEQSELSAEARRANARLRTTLTRTDRDFALAKSLVQAAQPPVPDVGPGVQVVVHHASGHPTGTDWWEITRTGLTVHIVLADTAGPATPAGAMLPVFLRTVVDRFAHFNPGKLLASVNQELIALALDDPPVVAISVLHLDVETGRFAVARAGAPRPVLVPEKGSPVEISLPGPLLGVFDAAEFPEHVGELRKREKLVLKTESEEENSLEDRTRIEVELG